LTEFEPTEQVQSEDPVSLQPITVWRVYSQLAVDERVKLLADDPATIASLITFMKAALQ
jgi:hypothetical protein